MCKQQQTFQTEHPRTICQTGIGTKYVILLTKIIILIKVTRTLTNIRTHECDHDHVKTFKNAESNLLKMHNTLQR